MKREHLKKAILKAIHKSEERCQFNDTYFNDEYVLAVEPVLNDLLFEVCRQERERYVAALANKAITYEKKKMPLYLKYATSQIYQEAIDVIKGLK